MILVGDSLGMTMLGYDSTLPVTMDDMVRHTAAVRRGAPNAWVIGDMPYMSYQPSVESAIRNAGRLHGRGRLRLGQAGGRRRDGRPGGRHRPRRHPVMGHLGLTPQSASALGGFRCRARRGPGAKIVDDAKILEEAGAFCILLELVPDRVCQLITERAQHCIIMSLGSGPHAHGQLLIYHDAFGLYPPLPAKFSSSAAHGQGLRRRRPRPPASCRRCSTAWRRRGPNTWKIYTGWKRSATAGPSSRSPTTAAACSAPALTP
jgi:3-methyl-2-oxobutanoate hydroxymethyltransferase